MPTSISYYTIKPCYIIQYRTKPYHTILPFFIMSIHPYGLFISSSLFNPLYLPIYPVNLYISTEWNTASATLYTITQFLDSESLFQDFPKTKTKSEGPCNTNKIDVLWSVMMTMKGMLGPSTRGLTSSLAVSFMHSNNTNSNTSKNDDDSHRSSHIYRSGSSRSNSTISNGSRNSSGQGNSVSNTRKVLSDESHRVKDSSFAASSTVYARPLH